MTEKVISYFKKVCSIPRASGDEKAVSDYIVDFARKRNLDVVQDEQYNVIVRKPATVSGSGEPVILQGHLDMVYVKAEGSSHVYEDGIQVQEEEGFYYADGTSLGADNGIAVAYCLAILDSHDILHPDLEIVFTVQEEVGLAGAAGLDISSLKGTRFINLDSEEEGIFYTSCAGGLRCRMLWDIKTEHCGEIRVPLTVRFKGLKGGHSGINIGMGLGNSIVLLGRLLYYMKDLPVRIHKLEAPGKANAIANSGSVCFYVKPEDITAVRERLCEIEAIFRQELQYTDTITFQIEEGAGIENALVYTRAYQKRIRDTLMLLPYGVTGYSFAVEGLIETSMNLGSLTLEDGILTLLMSLRSCVSSKKYWLRDQIQLLAEKGCDFCFFENDYPGWEYRQESPLRETASALYEEMFEKTAEVAAIHAGLECGYWDSKKPGMDIISLGPDLYDVHSVNEKVSKESIEHMWQYLKELLKKLTEI